LGGVSTRVARVEVQDANERGEKDQSRFQTSPTAESPADSGEPIETSASMGERWKRTKKAENKRGTYQPRIVARDETHIREQKGLLWRRKKRDGHGKESGKEVEALCL